MPVDDKQKKKDIGYQVGAPTYGITFKGSVINGVILNELTINDIRIRQVFNSPVMIKPRPKQGNVLAIMLAIMNRAFYYGIHIQVSHLFVNTGGLS